MHAQSIIILCYQLVKEIQYMKSVLFSVFLSITGSLLCAILQCGTETIPNFFEFMTVFLVFMDYIHIVV